MPFLANPALQSIRSDVFSLFFAVVLVVFGAVVALFGAVVALFGAVVLGWSVGVNRIRPALKLGKSFLSKITLLTFHGTGRSGGSRFSEPLRCSRFSSITRLSMPLRGGRCSRFFSEADRPISFCLLAAN